MRFSPTPKKYQYYPITRPASPFYRRYHGFGRVVKGRSATHDKPSIFLMVHFAWKFLLPIDRCMLAAIHPAFGSYAALRASAMSADISKLLQPRPPPSDRDISDKRVHAWASLLLRFDFNYGDSIRYVGGPYTNAHRNWDDTFLHLETVSSITPPPGYPPVDMDRAYRLATLGAPLQGHFPTSYASVSRRNLHPPSEALRQEAPAIREKLRKEEQLSYHVLLPRFLWRFIYGIHLCLLSFVYRYGDTKGRLCVDPSTTIDDQDDGNANRHIPDPGIEGKWDENPPHLLWDGPHAVSDLALESTNSISPRRDIAVS